MTRVIRLGVLVATVALLLVLASSALGAPAASAGEDGRRVPLAAQFVYDFKTTPYVCAQCGPGGTPLDLVGCDYAVFVQFPVVARASSYRVRLADHHPRVNVVRDLTGPPFNDDVEGYKAPAGMHRFGGLTGGSYTVSEDYGCPPPGDATQNGRFELLEAYATIPDDGKLHVSGTVHDGDGKGVAGVKVTVGSKKATTDSSGGYDVVVKKGTYTVSAAGYCVVGKPGCARSTSVKLPPSRTVDFAPPPEHTLSGTVIEQTCAQTCTRAGLAGVTVRATGGPGGPEETTSAADGTYALTLPEGTWRVTPELGEREFQRLLPNGDGNGDGFASVSLRRDESGIDFGTCGSAAAAASRRLAQSNPLCKVDLVVEGIELTNGIQETDLQDLTDGQGGLFSDAVDYVGIPLVAGRPAVVRVFVSTIAQRQSLGDPKVAAFEGAENVPVEIEVRQGSQLLRATTRIKSVDVWPVLPGARMNRVGSVAEFVVPGRLVRPGPLEVVAKLNPIDPVSSKQAIDECSTRACKDDNRVSVKVEAIATTPPNVVLVQLATKPDGVISSSWSGEGANQLWPIATNSSARSGPTCSSLA